MRGSPRAVGGHASAPAALPPPRRRSGSPRCRPRRRSPAGGDDVGPALGDAGRRPALRRDQGVERQQLLLERLLDRSRSTRRRVSPPPGASGGAASGAWRQVRSGERQLDRSRRHGEPDVLAVGRVLGQEVPADRDPPVVGRAGRSSSTDGGQTPSGQVDQAVDGDRVAGERADQGQLVDDAAQQDVAVEAAVARRPPRRRGPSGRSASASAPNRSRIAAGHVARRREQVGEGELRLGGRVEDGDLDRPERAPRRRSDRRAVGRSTTAGSEQLHVADLQAARRIGGRRGGESRRPRRG